MVGVSHLQVAQLAETLAEPSITLWNPAEPASNCLLKSYFLKERKI